MTRRMVWQWLVVIGAGVPACKEGAGPTLRPCTDAGFDATLAVGQYVAVDPTATEGCTVFPANGSGAEIEYLVVPQLASGTPGHQSSFRLLGDTIRPAASAALSRAPLLDRLAPAAAFHSFLRLGEERRSWGFEPLAAPALTAPAAPVAAATPPAYGSTRQFKVCARLDCTQFDDVTATVRAVKSKIAIYVDITAPGDGLDSLALDGLAALFDTLLYAVDTAAFGRESDIDSNTVVLVLMTPTVNELVTDEQCNETGFVAGFFLGADIDPLFQTDPRSNKGEVFYSLVADPSGSLNSCPHSAAAIQSIIPITFVHEFQHMISYNQHVLVRGGAGEVLWLNEGFSHYAEELAGRAVGGAAAGRLEDCEITPITTECRFQIGNLLNAYDYLDSTFSHFLLPTAGIGSLAERGAAWLFVRYLVDRHAGGATLAQWNAFTRQMVQTTQTGAANVAAAAGLPFSEVVGRWALANWVSDLPSFTAPAELRYDSWGLRATYASLNAQSTTFAKPFPLTPTQSVGRFTNLLGTLRAGSGIYHRATQPAGTAGFTTLFSSGSGGMLNGGLVPRLNVIRIR